MSCKSREGGLLVRTVVSLPWSPRFDSCDEQLFYFLEPASISCWLLVQVENGLNRSQMALSVGPGAIASKIGSVWNYFWICPAFFVILAF